MATATKATGKVIVMAAGITAVTARDMGVAGVMTEAMTGAGVGVTSLLR
jgi:hypothetical protein